MEEQKQNLQLESNQAVATARPRAQVVDFKRLTRDLGYHLSLQNPSKGSSRNFLQYTKENIKQYIQSPGANIDNIREVSAFLGRVSMLYKKILAYPATIPMWNYNVVAEQDFVGFDLGDRDKIMKKYQKCLKFLHSIDMRREFPNVIATALRDGVYFGFVYQFETNKFFLHALNPKYCRIAGKDESGQWIVYFNAAFFAAGNNSQFVDDTVQDKNGLWDQVFIDGYKAYQEDRNNNQWFLLPTEKMLCVLAGPDDEFEMPMPYFLPIFTSLLDLLDLEQILMSKTELQNYALLISKIPLIAGSDNVDDFAVSLDLAQQMQSLIDAVVPDLVGTAYSPFDVQVVTFDQSNKAEDTDKLAQSTSNLFKNAGLSELVVAGGASTNSIGLKHSIQNDEAMAFVYVDRIQSWLRVYMQANGFDKYIFSFHRQSYFNKDEFESSAKDAATLGGSAMDYLTARGMTPYEAYNKILMEQLMDIKSMMKPLQSSYTASAADTKPNGAPTKDIDDLSDEGLDTREANKNEGTRAAQ